MGDEAEKAIAALLAEHEHAWEFEVEAGREFSTIHCVGHCGWSLRQYTSPMTGVTSPSDERCYASHRAHVASVIAAHMAAPDELTAQANNEPCGIPHPVYPERLCDRPVGHDAHRRHGDAWATDGQAWRELVAERDALRERIRALADEWEREGCDGFDQWAFDRLRDLLGDA